MANQKITQLPSASIATGSNVLPIVQSGSTEQITVTNLGSGILNLGLPVTASTVYANSNGAGTNFKVGDDVWIGDVNLSNTMQIKGQQAESKAFIKFGSGSNSPIVGGTSGSGLFQITGSVDVSGSVTAKEFVQTSNVQGTGSLLLTPDLNDARNFEIYNTAPSDVHIKGNAGLTYFGDDTNYLKVDTSINTVTVAAFGDVILDSDDGGVYLNSVTGGNEVASQGWVNGIVGDTSIINNSSGHTITDVIFNIDKYATTGSNTFIGDQIVTGSLNVTGGITGSVSLPSGTISGSAQIAGLGFNYGLFSQTGSSTPITNTITETTLIDGGIGTLSVPANAFKVGDSFSVAMFGLISCNSSATVRIRVKTGDVILGDTGVIALDTATNKVWRLAVDFTVRSLGAATVASIVSGGFFSYVKNAGVNLEGYDFNTVNNTTFDTTISNTLNITAEWGAASTANSIYSDVLVLNKTY